MILLCFDSLFSSVTSYFSLASAKISQRYYYVDKKDKYILLKIKNIRISFPKSTILCGESISRCIYVSPFRRFRIRMPVRENPPSVGKVASTSVKALPSPKIFIWKFFLQIYCIIGNNALLLQRIFTGMQISSVAQSVRASDC